MKHHPGAHDKNMRPEFLDETAMGNWCSCKGLLNLDILPSSEEMLVLALDTRSTGDHQMVGRSAPRFLVHNCHQMGLKSFD